MPPRRIGRLILGGLAAAGLLAIIATTIAIGRPDGPGGTGSSFSSRPDGARAAYLTLVRLGFRVARSHEPLAALTADPQESVLILAGPLAGVSQQDVRALDRFVRAGGIVLTTGAGGARALGAADLEGTTPGDEPRRRETYEATADDPLTSGAPSVTMIPEVSRAGFAAAYERLYGPSTQPAVLRARLGEGAAVWFAGATPLTNEAIAEAANLELLLNILGDGSRTVVWDEHYHGHRRSLWSYLAGTPLPWLGAQAALVALAAAVTWSRRVGPPRPRVLDARTSPMEFVETMGGLYARAGVTSAAAEMALQRLRRTLASASGLGGAESDEHLAAAGAARTGLPAEALADALREGRQAASQAASLADALAVVRRLQGMAARVREARGSRRPS